MTGGGRILEFVLQNGNCGYVLCVWKRADGEAGVGIFSSPMYVANVDGTNSVPEEH